MLALCVLVRGNVDFTPEYVLRLRDALKRTLPRPHRLVCLTDQPGDMPVGVDVVQVDTPHGFPGWWSKLELFNPRHGLSGRAVYYDLDTVLVADQTPVSDYSCERMALIPHSGSWLGRGGRVTVPRYNSSVMVIDDVESHHDLYREWHVGVASRLWGDQDWIAERMPHETVMPLAWFPRISELEVTYTMDGVEAQSVLVNNGVRVVLCKKPKNHEALSHVRWLKGLW